MFINLFSSQARFETQFFIKQQIFFLLVELIEIYNLLIEWLFATTNNKMYYASPFSVQTSWINYQAPKNHELSRKLTIDTFNFKSFPQLLIAFQGQIMRSHIRRKLPHFPTMSRKSWNGQWERKERKVPYEENL